MVRASCLNQCLASDFYHTVSMKLDAGTTGAEFPDDTESGIEWTVAILRGLAGMEIILEREEGSESGTRGAEGEGNVAVVMGWRASGCFSRLVREPSCGAIWSRHGSIGGVGALASMVLSENARVLLWASHKVAKQRHASSSNASPSFAAFSSPSSSPLPSPPSWAQKLGVEAAALLVVWQQAASRVLRFADAAGIPAWSVCAAGGTVLEVMAPLRRACVYLCACSRARARASVRPPIHDSHILWHTSRFWG